MIHLFEIDYQLFHFINMECSNAFFDWLMPILRDRYTWFPFYLFLFVFLLVNFRKQGLYLALALALTVGLADVTSSHLIKKTMKRARPCKVLQQPKDLNLLVPCGSGYSFPSSHSANHFSMAVFLLLAFGKSGRWVKLAVLGWAASIAFAQVYVGVHFPFDVLVGAMLGSALASLVFGFFKKYFPQNGASQV